METLSSQTDPKEQRSPSQQLRKNSEDESHQLLRTLRSENEKIGSTGGAAAVKVPSSASTSENTYSNPPTHGGMGFETINEVGVPKGMPMSIPRASILIHKNMGWVTEGESEPLETIRE